MRTLNWRFAAGLLTLLILGGVGVFVLHAFQNHRIAADILAQSRQFHEQGQHYDSVRLAYDYFEFEPNDTAVLEELAGWLEAKATSRRQVAHVAGLIDRILQLCPERDDLRRKIIGFYVRTGDWAECFGHVQLLLAVAPDDPELLAQFAVCQEAIGKHAEAEELFEKSLRGNPSRVATALDYSALLIRHLHRADDGRKILEQSIERNPENSDLQLGLARCFRIMGKYPEAETAARDAIRLAPRDVTALAIAADICQAQGKIATAREILQTAIEIEPNNPRLTCSVAWLLVCDGKSAEAVAKLESGLKDNPVDAESLTLLGDLLAMDGKIEQLEKIVAELEQIRRTAPERGWHADYLQSRLLMRRGDWPAAAARLDALRLASRNQGLTKQANYLLATCYQQMRDRQAELDAYRRIFDADPQAGFFRLEYSKALARARQFTDAVREFRSAVQRPDLPARAVAEAVVELLDRCVRGGAADAVKEFERSFDSVRADDASPNSVLAKVELFRLRGRLAEASRVADQYLTKRPNNLAMQLARVRLLDDLAGPDRAANELAKLSQKFGDHADIRIVRIRLSGPRLSAAQGGRLLALGDGLETFSTEDRTRVLSELISAVGQTGDDAALDQALGRLRSARPDDLQSRGVLLTRALYRGDEMAIQQLLAETAAVEGPSGLARHLFEAQQLVFQSPNAAASALDEIDKLAPHHPLVAFLRGRMDEMANRPDAARGHYTAALDGGLLDMPIEDHFVALARMDAPRRRCRVLVEESGLFERVRLDTDRTVIRAMLPLAPASVRPGLADQILRGNPHADAAQLVWFGRLCEQLALNRQAESAFARATQRAPLSDEAWTARIGHHAAKQDLATVNDLVAQAKRTLPPADAGFVLARGLEAAGLPAEALKEIQSAVHREPDNGRARKHYIQLLVHTGRVAEARNQLREMVNRLPAASDDLAWARRTLALNLTIAPSLEAFREAMKLLDANGTGSDEDLRARAVVYMAQRDRRVDGDTPAYAMAHAILSDLDKRGAANVDDLLLLAHLYASAGDQQNRKSVCDRLARDFGGAPAANEYLARQALRIGDFAAVDRGIERMDPEQIETLALRATRAALSGHVESAVAMLEDYVGAAPPGVTKAARQIRCGHITFETLTSWPFADQPGVPALRDAAIRWYRAGLGHDPQALLHLAALYGKQGRIDLALDLLLAPDVRSSFSDEAQAAAAVTALRNGSPTQQQFQTIERMIGGMLKGSPSSVPLLLAQADLFEQTQRQKEAEVAYNRVLAIDPANANALNNLAWTESYDPNKMATALRRIQEAIDRNGPLDELIDTRARVLFASGRKAEALRDQLELTATAPNAARWFGLAAMYRDRPELAKEALHEAKRYGLSPADLHPRDAATYQELLARK